MTQNELKEMEEAFSRERDARDKRAIERLIAINKRQLIDAELRRMFDELHRRTA